MRVDFTDDAGHSESLTSGPTGTVTAGLELQSATVDGLTLPCTQSTQKAAVLMGGELATHVGSDSTCQRRGTEQQAVRVQSGGLGLLCERFASGALKATLYKQAKLED